MQIYDYDKDVIKNNLTIEQVRDLIAELGGEPQVNGDVILCKTICHGGNSHKLYYYDNTKLFRCYTGCSEPTFDIFELVRKVKSKEIRVVEVKTREGLQLAKSDEMVLPQAIQYVAQYFGYAPSERIDETPTSIDADLQYLENYDRINNISLETKIVELKTYDGSFLKNLPRPRIEPWIKDGISQEIMDFYEICYDPKNCGIVIPHRDVNGRLIGIRERTLIKENAELYGKYRPMKLNKQMYNHPLSFALYGLYQNQENIKRVKKAFVFESEKSVLQYATMFGQENNIAVAICGSSFIQYQAWLLINMGIQEIIVGLDKQYQELNDDEHKKLVRNLKGIHNKYGQFVTISYLFDKENLLSYKASPTDEGKEKFLQLYNNRVNLY